MPRHFLVIAFATAGLTAQSVLMRADFDAGSDGFTFADNAFRGSVAADEYAWGAHRPTEGRGGGGALVVGLGGVDDSTVFHMSGGWSSSFTVTDPFADVHLSLYVKVFQSGFYENDEFTQALVSIDGKLNGYAPLTDWAAAVGGDGNSTNEDRVTGWIRHRANLGRMTVGEHTIVIGGYNNLKTNANEWSMITIDDVLIRSAFGEPPPRFSFRSKAPRQLVDGTDFDRYKRVIEQLSNFGDRREGTPSYDDAEAWLISELQAAGYVVEHHDYTFAYGAPRRSTYVTKVGATRPDLMIMVSAHFDGRGGGGAADDDASGVAVVLECARAFGDPAVKTDISVRMVFWNNEETDIFGSATYARERLPLQGVEDPPGSGLFPEPHWLGIVQHDMVLFDHGVPPQLEQHPQADLDIEYADASSARLANLLRRGNSRYAAHYPAEVSPTMTLTDSVSFQGTCAAVSVRENQRIAEIGAGSNPHFHRTTDVFATYNDDDFRLGYDALRTTLGTVAELAGAQVAQWDAYGRGSPGTIGIPTLTAEGDPRLGETVNLRMFNGRGVDTSGALVLGFYDDARPFLGGTAWIDLSFVVTFNVSVPFEEGMELAMRVPSRQITLAGIPVYLQGFQFDPGANNGFLSMTNGLRLLIGL